MSARRALVKASTDRTVPLEYAGTLQPNFFCRGWNSKRKKYCRRPAGAGTTHTGAGRCKHHGGTVEGDKRVKHGIYSTIAAPRIRELLEELAANPDPLNVVDDLNLARALMRDFIERAAAGATSRAPEAKLLGELLTEYEILLRDDGDEPSEAQLEQLQAGRDAIQSMTAERALPDIAEAVKHVDVISKVIHRIEQLRTAGAFSLAQVHRFLLGVDRVIALHVADEPLRQAIRRDIVAIRP